MDDAERPAGSPGSLLRRLPKGLVATRRRRTYVQTVLAGYGYTAVSIVVNLALIPILVGGLGKATYGTWLTVAALVQWGTIVVGWLFPGFVKRIGDDLAKGDPTGAADAVANARRLYRSGGLAVVALGMVIAARPELGLGGDYDRDVRATILIAAAWLAFQVESQIEVTVLAAAQRLYVVSVIQSAVLLASGMAAATLVVLGFGLPTVAGSYAAAAAIGLVAYKVSRRRRVVVGKAAAPFQRAMLREIVSTTAPYALSVAGWVLLSSDIVLLALLTSPEVVATYGIAYKVVETMVQLIWRVPDSTQPYVVELNALGDREGLRHLYMRVSEATLMLAGSLAAVFFFLGDRFLAAWVGSEQAANVSVVRLLALYALLLALVRVSVIFPFSIVRMRAIAPVQTLEGAAKIVLAVPLVSAFGSGGVVVASIIAVTVLTGWYAPRFTARLLEVDLGVLARRLARRALPLPALAAVGAWLASETVPRDEPLLAFFSAAAVALVGAAAGAAATFVIRSRTG